MKTREEVLALYNRLTIEEIVNDLLLSDKKDNERKEIVAALFQTRSGLLARDFRRELSENMTQLKRLMIVGGEAVVDGLDDAKFFESKRVSDDEKKKLVDIRGVIKASSLQEMMDKVESLDKESAGLFSKTYPNSIRARLKNPADWVMLFKVKRSKPTGHVNDWYGSLSKGMFDEIPKEALPGILLETQVAWKTVLLKVICERRDLNNHIVNLQNYIKNDVNGISLIQKIVNDGSLNVSILAAVMEDEAVVNLYFSSVQTALANQTQTALANFINTPNLCRLIANYPDSLMMELYLRKLVSDGVVKTIVGYLKSVTTEDEDKNKVIMIASGCLPDKHPIRKAVMALNDRPPLIGLLNNFVPTYLKQAGNENDKKALESNSSVIENRQAVLDKLAQLMVALTEIKNDPGKYSLTAAGYAELIESIGARFKEKRKPNEDFVAFLWRIREGVANAFKPKNDGMEEAFDLTEYPARDKRYSIQKDETLAIGDLHGNVSKLGYLLCLYNIIDFKSADPAADYDKFIELCRKPVALLDKNDIAAFSQLLQKITAVDGGGSLKLIGDILADRSGNDFFTLMLLDRLDQIGVKRTILMSNHDAVFMEELNNLGKGKIQSRISQKSQDFSLLNLNRMIQKGLVTKDQIETLYDRVYKPTLKLIDYEHSFVDGTSRFLVRAHARIDDDLVMVDNVAKFFGLKPIDRSMLPGDLKLFHEGLAKRIDEINLKFSQIYNDKAAFNKFLKTLPAAEFKNQAERDDNPLHAIFWNRFYAKPDPAAKRDLGLLIEHGHDSSESNRPIHVKCLDNGFGSTPNHVKTLQSDMGAVVRDKNLAEIPMNQLQQRAGLAARPAPVVSMAKGSSSTASVSSALAALMEEVDENFSLTQQHRSESDAPTLSSSSPRKRSPAVSGATPEIDRVRDAAKVSPVRPDSPPSRPKSPAPSESPSQASSAPATPKLRRRSGQFFAEHRKTSESLSDAPDKKPDSPRGVKK